MHAQTILRSTLIPLGIATALITFVGTSRPSAIGSHFVPNRILLTRSTYTGTAQTVPFPGSLPNNAASVANGIFPGVFNNETPDGSFGVTSPIFFDQLAPSGRLLSTLNVTAAIFRQLGLHVTTSFPSKSELGLSFTPDNSAVTFMAYGAPTNSLDVSNSSTPGHLDITNPVNGQGVLIYQRDIIELNGDGNVQVTTTNTYSGNNGRNAALGSSGYYYMVGNAGNNGKSLKFAAGTVTFTSASAHVTLSGGSATANMYVGTPFSGPNVPIAAYVTAIGSPTDFTISATPLGASDPASKLYTADEGSYQLVGVNFASSATTITVADTSKLVPGMPLSGSGFAANSYIRSVTDATHFVASAATTTGSSAAKSYTAGVSNSMLSDDTGVQLIGKGEWDTAGTGTGILDAMTHSTVAGKVNGTYGSNIGYQRGFTVSQSPVNAPNDKTGKDDNFRGIRIFNDTLYVTKGSGGNGFDAVYQVNPSGGAYVGPGSSAGLPTFGDASTASINPLPGWPTDSLGACEANLGKPVPAGCSIVHHPFGIWFANATTLYVADEGSTTLANPAAGGLEKWIYNRQTGQWEWKYTIPASSIPGYHVTGVGNLFAVGLRNIAGITLDNGLVMIYAITSTGGETLNDEGADPNQLVSLTDPVAATTMPAGESFKVISTAAYGNVLRGVAVVSPGSGAQSR
jgi:hypothetical protein